MARAATFRGIQVKIRRPWGVFLLTVVTFSIYYLFWYYAANRELRDFGYAACPDEMRLAVSPGGALLAITLGGFLIVPPFVSEWRTFRRIGIAQERAGMHDRISHVTGFLLYLVALVLLPFEIVYAQYHLNQLCEHELAEDEKRSLGMRV